MDIKIEKSKFEQHKKKIYTALVALLLIVLVVIMATKSSSVTRVNRSEVTVASVESGNFYDYIRITGIVQPSVSVQLSAEEGGIVEEKFIEEGAILKAGDAILQLRNSSLDLEIMNAEANLAEKQNFLRNTQVSMEQDRLTNMIEKSRLDIDVKQKQRTYLQYERLYKEELVSKEEYLKAGEDYQLAKEQSMLVAERLKQDSLYRSLQMAQLENDLENMRLSLALIRERREKLTVKAPVSGELGYLDVEPGQSINSGFLIGRINVLTGHKIEAQIDEHYIDRVVTGLGGSFERRDSTYRLVVKKVYPDVRENKFRADLDFVGEKPDNIRNGQSYYINLELGESAESIILPRGTFFTRTGGKWVYVLDESGRRAYKREVRLGRQNPQYYEVLEGLAPGEKVVVTGYDKFGESNELIFK